MIKINNEIVDCKVVRSKFFKQGKCIILDCPYKLNKQNNNVLIAHLANKHRDIYNVESIELRKEFKLCKTRLRQRNSKSNDQIKLNSDQESESKIISYMAYLQLKAVESVDRSTINNSIDHSNLSSNILNKEKDSTFIRSSESTESTGYDSSGYYSTDVSSNKLNEKLKMRKDKQLSFKDKQAMIDLSNIEIISENDKPSGQIQNNIDEEIQIVFSRNDGENFEVSDFNDIKIVFE